MLPASEREKAIAELSSEQAAELLYDWKFWARPNQLEPAGDWQFWLVLGGRGMGKTRLGGEWVRSKVESKQARRIALVAEDAGDARDVMVEGDAGILAISHPNWRPVYEPSKRRLTWPNRAQATIYSAADYETLRGPSHDLAWCDEVFKWRYAQQTWDNLMLGLRLGDKPRCCITSTPRPTPLLKMLQADSHTVTTVGTTYENRGNLSPSFFSHIIQKYEGTRLGRQELLAHILDDVPGALWRLSLIDQFRIAKAPPDLIRIVVAIDPAVTATDESDETGIVVAGLGKDQHGYLLEDRSGRYSPDEWARVAIAAYDHWKADRVIGEANNGGDMVESTVRTVRKNLSFSKVWASRSKQTRAEPVSALYEQGKVHHVGGFASIEDEMTTWIPGMKSPSRMDAAVWAFTELMVGAVDLTLPKLASLTRTSPTAIQ